MKVSIAFVGGPQNGTYDLDYDPGANPESMPSGQREAFLFYSLCEGEVGKGASGITPKVYDMMTAGADRETIRGLPDAERVMTYHVTKREERGGVVYVTAQYKPSDKKK